MANSIAQTSIIDSKGSLDCEDLMAAYRRRTIISNLHQQIYKKKFSQLYSLRVNKLSEVRALYIRYIYNTYHICMYIESLNYIAIRILKLYLHLIARTYYTDSNPTILFSNNDKMYNKMYFSFYCQKHFILSPHI